MKIEQKHFSGFQVCKGNSRGKLIIVTLFKQHPNQDTFKAHASKETKMRISEYDCISHHAP